MSYTALEENLIKAMSLDHLEAESPIGFNFYYLWDPDLCPEIFLPWLAYTIGLPIFEQFWTEQEKRNVIKEYIRIRQIAGTKKALLLAYRTLNVDAEIDDRLEGDEFNSEILVKGIDEPIGQERIENVRLLTETFKPLRSRYDLAQFLRLNVNVNISAGSEALTVSKISGVVGND